LTLPQDHGTIVPTERGTREIRMARRKNAGTLARVRHAAQVVRDVANFCTNPLCLHVAGRAKCKLKCCRG